jgi:hypothetical protein
MFGYISDGRDKTAVCRVYIPEQNKIVHSLTVHVDERPHDLGSAPSLLPIDTGPSERESDLDMNPIMPILPVRSASLVPLPVQTTAAPVAAPTRL